MIENLDILADLLAMDPRSGSPLPADEPQSFAARLQEKHGLGIDPEVSLDQPATDAPSHVSSELLRRLADHSLRTSRYELQGEIARGGMGAILKVWDRDLRRTLAMKVILGKGDPSPQPGAPALDTQALGRFLEEAQVTGQLDHPGIAPVHELGLDSDGRIYFTMKLVKGRDLKHIFDLVRDAQEGWNETRALGVILKACEAIAYAHTKGVIHRDLKPANIMVGGFGEVYVMDWGLARVLGRKDAHDIRLKPEFVSTLGSIDTERREAREEELDSPLITMDGAVMGTPAYMPPEQARGEIEKLSARSDVYAIGAMLYHLLARRMPYVPTGARVSNRTVLAMVLQAPPAPLASLRKDVPAELVAICEKAMAREAGARYPDTLALAEDLRAYLEHRVVKAHHTGAVVELKKWVERNTPLAASIGAVIVAISAGVVAFAYKAQQSTKAAAVARDQERLATEKADDVLSLSAIQDLQDLVARAATLWPADPRMIPAYELWLDDARVLIEGKPSDLDRGIKKRPSLTEHKAKLAELRSRAKPHADHEPELEQTTGERLEWQFSNAEDSWWHAQLWKLTSDLEALRDPKSGLDSHAVAEPFGWGVRKRHEFARTIAARSITDPEASKRWAEAIAAIAASTVYKAISIKPQSGLLPIGVDPDSGCWEFAHLQTGEAPERGADGRLVLSERTGLVFVLLPAGSFWMGAQNLNLDEPNYDPHAVNDQSPVNEVPLDAFFLSKYEMTQGQWERIVARNPSLYGPARYSTAWNRDNAPWSALHPVEQVSWSDCATLTNRIELCLPTEAQWEYACRGGTSSVYWAGDAKEDLHDAANLSDAFGKSHGNDSWTSWEEWLDDGNTAHATIGSYRANPFGLHDMHGNVWEWCRDAYGDYSLSAAQGDGERQRHGANSRVLRGGSFSDGAAHARSALRLPAAPDFLHRSIGLRPAKRME